MDVPSELPLKGCHCCGLVQEVPRIPPGGRALCGRCGAAVSNPARTARANERARAAALAALIVFPLAINIPVLRTERFGHVSEASIWSGSIALLREGELLVGGVVLFCSILIPLVKLIGLLAITTAHARWRRHRATTYRIIEWAGRWGMLDVLLISLVVAWIKMGDLLEVHPGPGALAFTVCVLLSLLSSAWFDPHAIWDGPEEPA